MLEMVTVEFVQFLERSIESVASTLRALIAKWCHPENAQTLTKVIDLTSIINERECSAIDIEITPDYNCLPRLSYAIHLPQCLRSSPACHARCKDNQ